MELLQAKQESFFPRDKGLRNKGRQKTTHQTVNGRIGIRRTVYWSVKTGSVIPADAWLGIAAHRFSPGVREMCCREALHCSFDVAAENLQRTAQVSLSGGAIRQVVENQGRAVRTAQGAGALRPGFTAADCTAETIITGADGVMVPLVTEQQKRQRRKSERSAA